MPRYGYDGTYIDNKPFEQIFFGDFIIGNSGERLYHTSKRTNFNDDESPISYNLWVDRTGKKDYSVYFPYDYDLFPNGSMSFETRIPFSTFGDSIRYHYNFSNVIYNYSNEKVSQAYFIDFGEKAANVDFNKINNKEALNYIKDNKNKATFIQDFIETEDWLRFNYLIRQTRVEVFFDKVKNKLYEGNLVDDIFGIEMLDFIAHKDGKIIGWILPDRMKLQDNAKRFFDAETLKRLKNMPDDDNPFLIEVSLKFDDSEAQ